MKEFSHNITISKTSRVVTSGDAKSARIALITLHGYGQLVPYFIRKFNSIESDACFIVAPEGMHRFYLNGTSGRVGASWMTKEARLDDIRDNNQYLDEVYRRFILNGNFEKTILLGFSQGAATAARWCQNTAYKIDAFVQWAGVFPPDIEIDLAKFKEISHFYVVGDQDPYFNDKYDGEYNQSKWLVDKDLNPEIVTFAGKHDMDLKTLEAIIRKLD
jgi:predicted esterase